MAHCRDAMLASKFKPVYPNKIYWQDSDASMASLQQKSKPVYPNKIYRQDSDASMASLQQKIQTCLSK